MENKSNEEWAELVRAQVAVIDGLRLELATRQPVQQPAAVIKEFAAAKGIAVRDVYKISPEVLKSFEGCGISDMSVPFPDPVAAAVVGQERWANAINALLSVATAAYRAMDSSEERANAIGGEDAEYIIQGNDFTALSAAMDEIDALPDDRPGYTLAGGARASWALRDLFTASVPAAGVQGDERYREGFNDGAILVEEVIGERDAARRQLAQMKSDSGRDAALIADADTVLAELAERCSSYDPERDYGGSMELRDTYRDGDYFKVEEVQAVIRALAAHPAPSSDAATMRALIEDAVANHKSPKGYIDLCMQHFAGTGIFAAHPANGAQAVELSDAEIVSVWQEMPGGPDGWLKSFGFLQFARAILAAAKKGGA